MASHRHLVRDGLYLLYLGFSSERTACSHNFDVYMCKAGSRLTVCDVASSLGLEMTLFCTSFSCEEPLVALSLSNSLKLFSVTELVLEVELGVATGEVLSGICGVFASSSAVSSLRTIMQGSLM